LVSFGGDKYDHMGLGAFELLNAPTAQLQLQAFQCPQPNWIRGATANVALATRVGTHTVVIVGDALSVFNGTDPHPLISVDKWDTGTHDYSVDSIAGVFRLRRTAARNQRFRWRIESRDWLVSSYTYPAPAGLVAMGHMMNFQIGLGPHHVTLTDNSGLCTHKCTGVSMYGSTSCEHADCNVLPESDALFSNVNSSLYSYLMHQCSGDNNPDPRSPCDPPSSDDACDQTGFPMADAIAACASLQSSPNAYDSCIYDCCVTADTEFCKGLAEESDEETQDFEKELIDDGRFVNIDDHSEYYSLNESLPSPAEDRLVCSMAFGESTDSLEVTVLPNGLGYPGTLSEVRANIRNLLLLLDADASNRSNELSAALEAAHMMDGQLYACSEFHLQPAHVGYEGATSIAASLQLGAMPRLEQLTLSSNNLGSNGTSVLVNAIHAGGPRGPILRNLRVLNLRHNLIDDDAVEHLTSAVLDGALASLQFVDLADNPANTTSKAQLMAARSGLIVR